VQKPDAASLLLTVNVLQNLQDIIPFCINFSALGDLHTHVLLDWCLKIGQNIINLERLPAIYDGQDQDKPDDDPVCYWGIGFVVVPPKDLARSIEAKPCLPLVDLLGEDAVLAPHLPDP